MRTDDIRKNLDIICDFVPFVSTINSCVDLVQKNVYYVKKINDVRDSALCNSTAKLENNHYREHLGKKHNVRCLVTLIPVAGNIGLAIYLLGRKAGKKLIGLGKSAFEFMKGLQEARKFAKQMPYIPPEEATPEQKKDPRVVKEWIKKNPEDFQHADISLRSDPKIVERLIQETQDATIFKHAEENVKADRNVVKTAAKIDPQVLDDADPALLEDGDFMADLLEENQTQSSIVADWIKKDPDNFQRIPISLRSDPETVERLIQETQDATILKHAEEAVKADRNVVKTAAKIDPQALDDADPALLEDGDFMGDLLEENQKQDFFEGDDSKFEYRDDGTRWTRRIFHADERARRERELLQRIDPALMGDPEYVSRLLKITGKTKVFEKGGEAFEFATPELKKSKSFVLDHIKENPYMYPHCDQEVRKDRDIHMALIQGSTLSRSDELVEQVLEENEALGSDAEFMMHALKSHYRIVGPHLHETLKKSTDFIKEAAETSFMSYKDAINIFDSQSLDEVMRDTTALMKIYDNNPMFILLHVEDVPPEYIPPVIAHENKDFINKHNAKLGLKPLKKTS